jgi:hypothetical protein
MKRRKKKERGVRQFELLEKKQWLGKCRIPVQSKVESGSGG